MEARKVLIHQSLHRHNLVLGAEREPVMTAALIALLVGIGGMTLITTVCAVVFWIGAVFCLRRMAKADPIMTKVWLRSIKQQDFYPAKASVWRIQGGFQGAK